MVDGGWWMVDGDGGWLDGWMMLACRWAVGGSAGGKGNVPRPSVRRQFGPAAGLLWYTGQFFRAVA